jgi:hypothetical protein
LNPRQPGPQPGALPTELHPPYEKNLINTSYILIQEIYLFETLKTREKVTIQPFEKESDGITG